MSGALTSLSIAAAILATAAAVVALLGARIKFDTTQAEDDFLAAGGNDPKQIQGPLRSAFVEGEGQGNILRNAVSQWTTRSGKWAQSAAILAALAAACSIIAACLPST